jgi:hypothetical protein
MIQPATAPPLCKYVLLQANRLSAYLDNGFSVSQKNRSLPGGGATDALSTPRPLEKH